MCALRTVHEPRLAANKVPLKLTSLNFELMAGQDGGGMQGLGIGGQGIGGAPGSAGALGAPSGVAGGPPASRHRRRRRVRISQ